MYAVSTEDLFKVLSDVRLASDRLDDLMRFAENMVRPVRCKECAHWYKRHCAHGWCATFATEPDFFCADGERRDEDGETDAE